MQHTVFQVGIAAMCVTMSILATGCAEPVGRIHEERSGTRLRRRFVVSEGGARLFVGWYDVELNSMVNPANGSRPSSVGQLQDPFNGSPDPWVHPGQAFYANPICSELVVGRERDCEELTYIRDWEVGGLYYPVEETVPADSLFTLDLDSGDCIEATAVEGVDYFRLGLPITDSSFVELTHQGTSSISRLGKNVFTGADGSALHLFPLHDHALNVDCFFGYSPDGVLRCLPDTGCIATAYASCEREQPVAMLTDTDLAHDYCRAWESAGCLPVWRYFSLGEQLSQSMIYGFLGSSCYEIDVAQLIDQTVFAMGEEIPPSTFAELQETQDVAGQRLHAMGITTTDDLRIPSWHPATFWDTARNEACVPATAGDGLLRCLPKSGVGQTAYLDDTCTTPVIYTQAPDECDAQPSSITHGRASCFGEMTVYQVGAEASRNGYYSVPQYSASCIEHTGDMQILLAAETIPPSEFVELTYQTE